jgi:hypothetical protein
MHTHTHTQTRTHAPTIRRACRTAAHHLAGEAVVRVAALKRLHEPRSAVVCDVVHADPLQRGSCIPEVGRVRPSPAVRQEQAAAAGLAAARGGGWAGRWGVGSTGGVRGANVMVVANG